MTMLKRWMDRTPDEHVILQSASDQNLPVKGTALIKQIKLSCGSGQFAIMRSGDTIFWYHIDNSDRVDVCIFNADSLSKLVQNLDEFTRALFVAKYKIWYTATSDPMLVAAIKKLMSNDIPSHIALGPINADGKQSYSCSVSVEYLNSNNRQGGT